MCVCIARLYRPVNHTHCGSLSSINLLVEFCLFLLKPHFVVQSSESRPVPLRMNYFLVKEENISVVISLFSDPYPDLANSSCGWSTVWLLMGSVTSVWFSSVQLDLYLFSRSLLTFGAELAGYGWLLI